jgi:uncharacterized GH25 family protein
MIRRLTSLVVLLLAAPLARAHFIWIVPDKDGASAQVVFSDGPKPDDPKLLAKIAKTDVFARSADGKTTNVKWTEGKDAYLVTSANKQKWLGLAAVCRYGVTQRGKAEPFLLNYYAACVIPAKETAYADKTWEQLPLQFVRLDATRFQVVWQGKPLADAEVAIEAPGEDKGQETKADAKGMVTVSATKPGLYGLRARHVEAKGGDLDGKTYKEVRHYSTLVVHLDAAETKADPAATRLLAEARAMRAVWRDFPGFTADVEVNFDGKIGKGTAHVAAGGKDVTIDGLDKAFEPWARRELESIVNHRLPGSSERETPCAFADTIENHPLGRAIRVLNEELHSSYRVRGKEIVVVNRTMKDRRFTITVLESMTNKEGKFLTTSFVVDYWNLETNDLVRSDAVSQTWQRVGAFDLPGTTRAITARGKSFAGDVAKEDAFTGKSLTLTNHKLLEGRK